MVSGLKADMAGGMAAWFCEDTGGQERWQETENVDEQKSTKEKTADQGNGVLLLLLLAVLAVVFLFQAKTVTVYGVTRHTEEEIKEGMLNNILHKNTLYLQWKYRNGAVPDTLPFLKSLKVSMKSPMEIEVQVTEKEPVAYLDKGEYIYFDADGIVLELSDKEDSNYPVITGVEVDDPVLYQKLPMQSSAQLRTILSITQLLSYQDLQAKEIRFGDNGDLPYLSECGGTAWTG